MQTAEHLKGRYRHSFLSVGTENLESARQRDGSSPSPKFYESNCDQRSYYDKGIEDLSAIKKRKKRLLVAMLLELKARSKQAKTRKVRAREESSTCSTSEQKRAKERARNKKMSNMVIGMLDM